MPRKVPLFHVPDEGTQLMPALWYAMGVASMINSFADIERRALHLVEADQSACTNCNQLMVSSGLIAQIDSSGLSQEGLNMLGPVLKAAIEPMGLSAELHIAQADCPHIAVTMNANAEREGTHAARHMLIPAGPFPNELAVVHGAADGGGSSAAPSRSSAPPQRSQKRSAS
jgi:hypothetical protein